MYYSGVYDVVNIVILGAKMIEYVHVCVYILEDAGSEKNLVYIW